MRWRSSSSRESSLGDALAESPAAASEQALGKAFGPDGVAGGEDHRTLEDAHQLADVAVPAVAREQPPDVG